MPIIALNGISLADSFLKLVSKVGTLPKAWVNKSIPPKILAMLNKSPSQNSRIARIINPSPIAD